ncbi:hypothetical protein ACI2OX_05870 [Bacillus sp. N9]
MFDQRSYELFKEITKYDQITKFEIMRIMNLSDRQFYYDLEKVNYALDSFNLPKIDISNNIFVIDEKLKEVAKSGMHLDVDPKLFSISERDRILLVYLYTFVRKNAISNYHYQLLLGVSKNTALTDVKRVRELCSDWNIEIVYKRTVGYHLVGNEFDKED